LPLIGFDDLALDWLLLQEIFAEVTGAFATYSELFNEFPESLKKLEPRPSLPEETVKAWFEGGRLPSLEGVDNLSEHLLEAIIHATLKPFLVSYSEALLGLVNQERWRRGYCPICGGNPDFAFLDNERGARWLLCSRCDAEWLFQRLECPYCGNQEQNALAYFTDDEGLYRLYICEKCKRYLKAIDLRQAKSEVLLPLERLITFGLDAQAREYGYSPADRACTR
jgi:FdhE protein